MPPPIGAPPQIPHAILVQQKQGSAVMIWAIGAFCIFGWEWLLCLPQEYERIWKKPMNISSVLYIANRYFGMLQFVFVITLMANIWNPSACKHAFFWEPVGALISTVLSQMILGSRVYAIFAKNKAVAFILGFILIIEVVIGGISISTTTPPPASAESAPTGPPCGAVMGPFGWLIAFWTLPLLYDALTFLLTAWKAYNFWKREVDTPLFNIIWRDGLLYFFVIFSMNAANVIIFLTVPEGLRAINLTPTLILEVILSCRLLLNLRSAGERSASKPPIVPWSDNSQTYTHPSSGALHGNPSRSTMELGSIHGRGMKLEPNRQRPADIKVDPNWNSQTLYTK